MAAVTWDSNFNLSPTIANRVRNTPVFIQQTRAAVQERLAVEHCVDLTDGGTQSDHGKHLQGSARVFVSDTEVEDPTTVVADDADYATGRLQVYPTSRRLAVYYDDAWVDLLRNESGQIVVDSEEGTAPFVVASTTVVTNLNADLLDGRQAGNISGAIPISNGTVCANLNANMLDGCHVSTTPVAGTIPRYSSYGQLYTSISPRVRLFLNNKTQNDIYDTLRDALVERANGVYWQCSGALSSPAGTLILAYFTWSDTSDDLFTFYGVIAGTGATSIQIINGHGSGYGTYSIALAC